MNSMVCSYSQQVLTLSRNDREIVKTSDFGDQLLWSNTTDRDNDNLYRKFLPSLHVNIQNTHWCFIELDTEESNILMYASLDWKNKTFLDRLKGLLERMGKKMYPDKVKWHQW